MQSIHNDFLSVSTFSSSTSSVFVIVFIFPFSNLWPSFELPSPLQQVEKAPYVNPQKMLMSMCKSWAYIRNFTVYSKVVNGTCSNRKSSKF